MYILKLSYNNQILAIRHYNSFQNALADVADLDIINEIVSSDIRNSLGECGNPKISFHTINKSDIADDFEFKYDNGLLAYIGEVLVKDNTTLKENL